MTTVSFDGLTLSEPEIKRSPKPTVNSTRLVSGKIKLTISTEIQTSWQISCLVNATTEYTALAAKMGISGSLVVDGTTYAKCAIKSWKEKELNPSVIEVTITLEQDTT